MRASAGGHRAPWGRP